ncbi:MAG: peptidylprolyl isomerase, partial [Ruminiclostridium sp.]|nr:peptidylprolyl isomerase [Ruminiclostridium sp.]
MAQNPIVTIEMENGGKIVAELYPEVAPISVNNFISLIKKGFYDGIIFHRVISGFMIQGGDPQGTGMGGPGYCIKGEFAQNGVKNDLSHKRGVLSMARTMVPNSVGSQFFIMHA